MGRLVVYDVVYYIVNICVLENSEAYYNVLL